MTHSSSQRLRRFFSFLACSGILCAASVHAKRVALTDHEMSDVNAQGLFILENSLYQQLKETPDSDPVFLNFSKIALDADVTLNANFRDILLGKNSQNISDINISALQFGRTDGSEDNRTVKITNPYIEFVYNKKSGAPTQVVGVRLGFDGISGDIGFGSTKVPNLNVISGSMYVADSNGVTGNKNNILDFTGKYQTGSNAPCGTGTDPACSTYLQLSQLGGITVGNASGPSRDFWISALMSKVQFPPSAGMTEPPKEAQPGYWLNWRDRLMALSATLPSNSIKQLQAVKP